jgi:hypothetical protein
VKQKKILLIAILMTIIAHGGWKPLKNLDHYGPKAFTLKKGVVYVELRKYCESTQKTRYAKYSKSTRVALQIYQTLPHNKNVFSRIPLKERYAVKKGEWGGLVEMGSWYYNGFMLDNAGKTWRLENAKDVIDMIKPIDTPAEVRLILWLDPDIYSSDGDKYRKNGNGYIVKSHYVIHDSSQGAGCGDYSYQYKISRSGKITQKKLLRKKHVKDCGSE